MGTTVQLTTVDGNTFDAYKSEPEGLPKGGVVVVQEIFGVNDHIKSVTDGYAEQGYLAIAPALFDRARAGVELGYDETGIEIGRKIAFEDISVNPLTLWSSTFRGFVTNFPTLVTHNQLTGGGDCVSVGVV